MSRCTMINPLIKTKSFFVQTQPKNRVSLGLERDLRRVKRCEGLPACQTFLIYRELQMLSDELDSVFIMKIN